LFRRSDKLFRKTRVYPDIERAYICTCRDADFRQRTRYNRSNIMKRTLAAALFVSLFASTAAFADGGIGHNGSYQDQSWIGTSTKTRAQVRAELVAARRDGTLPSMNKQSYPELSLAGQTQAARVAAAEGADTRVSLARAGQ